MASAEDVAQSLERILEGVVLSALSEPGTTDVHVNPDGEAFASSSKGRRALGPIDPSVVERALLLMADHRGGELRGDPLFKAELPAGEPFRGARLQAVLPPLTKAPALSLRMHSAEVFPLEAFSRTPARMGIEPQPEVRVEGEDVSFERVRAAVFGRENLVIYGATGTGKTSLVNAALAAAAAERPTERVLVLEDTFEIQVTHRDQVAMRTEDSMGIELHDLVRASLRMQPDRIVVGEVRGPEALDLLDAWWTGHRGGLATIHASSAEGALARLEHLASRHRHGVGGDLLREYVAGAVGVLVGMRLGATPYLGGVERVELDASGNYELRAY